ncbi:MAG: tRNA-dihydrouridine synthase family protein [Planctomycetes bacterium]|nr:tRNA-dihydrouridine synthase family protein [Planctomycetota bacterium]
MAAILVMTSAAQAPTARTLPFTAPWLLAPMEGVTEPCFRDLVLARNQPEHLGGTFTEFVRVHAAPVPRAIVRRHIGPARHPQPVGVQLMGNDLERLAATARNAVAAGAPLVDLNFGCPAKGAIAGCAGSALLKDPAALERVVRAVASAVSVPVSAKIRAGYDDASHVEELARAAEQGGAAMLTVHCRTRAEGYCREVDWTRIARAASAVSIPVCGNGGILTHGDFERLRRVTGARFAMVGRGALADPWIFSGRSVTRGEAARFLVDYAHLMRERKGWPGGGIAARVKQLLRYWTAGGLVESEEHRLAWLREQDGEALLGRLRALAAQA